MDPKIKAISLSQVALSAISTAAQMVGRPIIRPGSPDYHFPDDTVLVALNFEGLAARSVRIVRSSAEKDENLDVTNRSVVYITSGLRLVDIARIYLTTDDDQSASGSVTLDLSYLARRFTGPPITIQWPAGKGERLILELSSDRQDRRQELVAHLNANRVYYGNAIYRNLDSGTIIAMLAEYGWNGKPLIDQVEPQPLTMAGNYLVFRAPVEPADPSGVKKDGSPTNWGDLLHDRGIEIGEKSADERLIPLPTSGVFAEAVLGRSNSAEKLDITRFWNWQDSPTPLTPPEILPVSAGSRATNEGVMPGQLGQPVLNIVNPQSLPTPAGLGAAFAALSTPNMFRDMSGLAGTQNLVQSGMQETLQAATDAGQLASANMRTEAQKSVAMAQVAADIVKSVVGAGAVGSSGASQTMSGAGAAINHGQRMDKAASGSTDGSGRTLPAGGGGSSNGAAGGSQDAAYRKFLHGDMGASGSESIAAAQRAGSVQQAAPKIASPDPDSAATFQNVSETVIIPKTKEQIVGLIGELMIERALKNQGHQIFKEFYKGVSNPGVDLITLAPDGTVWLIDNKAWMKGINGAEALTGPQSIGNFKDVLDWLNQWPAGLKNKANAEVAVKALQAGNYKQVVSNAFAGETARFTKSIFAKSLAVYDVRMQKLFVDHASWETGYKLLSLRKGLRATGARGAASLEGILLVLAVSAAAGVFLLRADSHVKQMMQSVAADLIAGVVLEKLSTKLFKIGSGPAGLAVLTLDFEPSPGFYANDKRNQVLRELIPDFDKLSEADQMASNQALKELMDNPLEIDEPQPQIGHPAPAGPYTPRAPPVPSLPPGTGRV